ncbi:hypothetical protein [Solimonas terrae]|uniref:Uncharacterized protein n=1 Tax=Solimonas terrae TaxID=1396819 RepID=A0A6M2BWD1_9GAMM|nr:hypothetical protein [Solimonas terrae]NGY06952.1 hypothetical protein [Solimonas terrae]
MKGMGGIRFFALLDVLITAPLAVPGLTHAWALLLLSAAGLLPVPERWSQFTPATLLFAQLLGVLGACWNGARLFRPDDRRLLGIDAVARLAVAVLLVIQLVVGAPPALGFFVVTELVGATLAFLYLRRRRAAGW